MHAVASSSASVKPVLIAAEYPYQGIVRFTLSGGVSIVSRNCYFDCLFTIDQLPLSLTDTQLENIYHAGRIYLAEKKAQYYLNRAEHSTYQLNLKLQKKGFSPGEVQPALAYLTEAGLLDDSRFAAAWLHTRGITKQEGYQRLFAELLKRGISAEIARIALNDLFAETDEECVCRNAAGKLIRRGYAGAQLVRALQRKGFSFSMIKRCAGESISAAAY